MRKGALLAAVVAVAMVASGCALGIAGSPSAVSTGRATINGKVFSNTGGNTDYWVKYGKTTGYGSETAHQSVAVDPDEDERGVQVSVPLAGLERSTTYHYRLCAKDSQAGAGIGCDGDKTFITLARTRFVAEPACLPTPTSPFKIVMGPFDDQDDFDGFKPIVYRGGVIFVEESGGVTVYVDRTNEVLDDATLTYTADGDFHRPLQPGEYTMEWLIQGGAVFDRTTPLQIGNCG